jgi:hypothetical protein
MLLRSNTATSAERDAVDAWLMATACADVSEVMIEELAVVLYGSGHRGESVMGTALRHGDLPNELHAALAAMRLQTGARLPARAGHP